MKKPVTKIYHYPHGKAVESPCICHGLHSRIHSEPNCLFEHYRRLHPDDAEFEQLEYELDPEFLRDNEQLKGTPRWIKKGTQMKIFKLKADAEFEATDITDAFERLASHFSKLARWTDSDFDHDEEVEELLIVGGEITVSPYVESV